MRTWSQPLEAGLFFCKKDMKKKGKGRCVSFCFGNLVLLLPVYMEEISCETVIFISQ